MSNFRHFGHYLIAILAGAHTTFRTQRTVRWGADSCVLVSFSLLHLLLPAHTVVAGVQCCPVCRSDQSTSETHAESAHRFGSQRYQQHLLLPAYYYYYGRVKNPPPQSSKCVRVCVSVCVHIRERQIGYVCRGSTAGSLRLDFCPVSVIASFVSSKEKKGVGFTSCVLSLCVCVCVGSVKIIEN